MKKITFILFFSAHIALAFSLRGTVVNSNGEPIGNAKVIINQIDPADKTKSIHMKTVITSHGGAFYVKHISGFSKIGIFHPDYEGENYTIDVVNNINFDFITLISTEEMQSAKQVRPDLFAPMDEFETTSEYKLRLEEGEKFIKQFKQDFIAIKKEKDGY